jgi:hypothetical protein
LPALNKGQSEKSDWPFPFGRVERTLLSAALDLGLGFVLGVASGQLLTEKQIKSNPNF